jgi:hypothetical protein
MIILLNHKAFFNSRWYSNKTNLSCNNKVFSNKIKNNLSQLSVKTKMGSSIY